MSVVVAFYFVWRRPSFDKYFLLYFILMNLSWVLFKDECLISYIYKKVENPDYVLGETNTVDDYDRIFGKELSKIFLGILIPILYVFNLAVIGFNKKIWGAMLLGIASFIVYISSLRVMEDNIAIKYAHGTIYTGLLGGLLYSSHLD
jgi:hypothetical protein